MITDKTLDEAMVEAARFLKAAKALRAARKADPLCPIETCNTCFHPSKVTALRPTGCFNCGGEDFSPIRQPSVEHAACKRASLDLTHKLADLRAGR